MGIGFRELIVILIIVLLIFGAKKLRSLGSDFGSAVKNFRESMKDGEQEAKDEQAKKDEATQRSDGQPPAK